MMSHKFIVAPKRVHHAGAAAWPPSTRLHRPPDDPHTFVLHDVWACSKAHFLQHHLAKPYRQAFEAALPRRLRAGRTIEFLDLRRSDAKA